MALLFAILCIVLFIVVGVLALLLMQIWQHGKYFKGKGVHYLPSHSFQQLVFFSGYITMDKIDQDFYQKSKNTGNKFTGFSDSFTSPAYYVTDLDLMRNIYVKDFEHFVDRRKMIVLEEDMMGKMLLMLESDHWKGLRSKLSPSFTTGKIKRMFSIFDRSSQRMCDYLKKEISDDGDIEISQIFSKFSMDVIASCVFGVDSKSFETSPDIPSPFEEMAQRFQFKLKMSMLFKIVVIMAAPKLAKLFGLQILDTVPQDYFNTVIKQVIQHRRETGQRENDFLQLMMDTQEGLMKDDENSKETMEVMGGVGGEEEKNNAFSGNKGIKFKFDDDDIAANCVVFLIGGFDTFLSLLSFSAYHLALEPEIQQKLFYEVQEFMDKNDGKLTYESLLEMNYLDMFVHETLRFYPPAARTERRCTKEYTIPGTNTIIEKDQMVSLAVYGVHHDPEIYENPEKFDPERFLPENKSKRHPYSFAPFGHGPRNCIGMRFALLEAKAIIASLVFNFKLEPCSKTNIPIKFSTGTNLKPVDMWLNLSPRSEE